MTKASDKIDAAAAAAKQKADQLIDDAARLAAKVAAKAAPKVHAAGDKMKRTGDRILKLAE